MPVRGQKYPRLSTTRLEYNNYVAPKLGSWPHRAANLVVQWLSQFEYSGGRTRYLAQASLEVVPRHVWA